jgi:AAA domain
VDPADVAAALAAARIDLVKLIDEGIPEREFIKGTGKALPAHARLLIAAEKKTGKSLAIGIVLAIRIIKAGGTVAVLDRENGADEYARRLEAVLDAWDADGDLRERVRERYRYYAFPAMKLAWGADGSYPAAFEGVDAVIFDSSRPMLTSLGLKENSSDDYDVFVQAIINPLWQSGAATIILDNTGHNGGLARGSSSKGDLCDVEYAMKQVQPFNEQERGAVELRVQFSRFGDVFGTWRMELGGGTFGQLERSSEKAKAKTRDRVRDRIVDELEAKRLIDGGGLNGADVCRAVDRDKGDQTVRRALKDMLAEGVLEKDEKTGIYTVVVSDNGEVTT